MAALSSGPALPDACGVLCVFAKAPVPGHVKTRLAKALGDPAAADLARGLLLDSWETASRVARAHPILVLSGDAASLPALCPAPEIHAQGDGDLGARMQRALSQVLAAGAPWALLVGTDLPGLPGSRLEQAVSALERGAAAVLGPTDDGGFYLVGLSRCPPGLLSELPWSEPSTFQHTRERLREHGLEPELVDSWFDLDEPRDLERARRAIVSGRIHAPHTADALARAAPRISVIVPVLDERARIGQRLDELERAPGIDEVIVVDGGSRDGTPAIVAARDGAKLLRAPRGRALQMNAGAHGARGEVLLFLHADSQLPADAAWWIDRRWTTRAPWLAHSVPGTSTTALAREVRPGYIWPTCGRATRGHPTAIKRCRAARGIRRSGWILRRSH